MWQKYALSPKREVDILQGSIPLLQITDAHHTAPLAATAIHNQGDKLCPITPDIHFRLIPSGEMALCSHDSPGRSDGKP